MREKESAAQTQKERERVREIYTFLSGAYSVDSIRVFQGFVIRVSARARELFLCRSSAFNLFILYVWGFSKNALVPHVSGVLSARWHPEPSTV